MKQKSSIHGNGAYCPPRLCVFSLNCGEIMATSNPQSSEGMTERYIIESGIINW